jgi:tellurite resistance protein
MSTAMGTMMNESEIAALVACMLSVAHVDGMRPQEDALIRKFYADSWVDGMPAFETLQGNGGKALDLLAALRPSADFSNRMVTMCAMTGFCDGDFTAAERAQVDRLAAATGVSAARVEELVLFVKDSLIQSLAHLPDSGGVAALAKSL